MDGATSSENQENKFVIVLAATNRPWDLDEALRRRLEKRIYIPLPTEKGRMELVKISLRSVKLDENLNLDFVVQKTEGFSGADISNVCREAAYMPMRRKLKRAGGFKNIDDIKKFEEEVNVPLTREDFLEALKNVNKSVGKDDIKKYELWMN
jgi:katanin p60 ATPase-containing subunit A1